MTRDQAHKAVNQGMWPETTDTSSVVVSSTPTATSSNTSLTSNGLASNISSVTPTTTADWQLLVSRLFETYVSHSIVTSSTIGVEPSTVGKTSVAPTIDARIFGLTKNSAQQSKMPTPVENQASQDLAFLNGSSRQDIQEAKRGLPVVGKNSVILNEEKTSDDETLVHANKLEAKDAFKALLEYVNVQSDWTWAQTMREIINDKRYISQKHLGKVFYLSLTLSFHHLCKKSFP
ncbi:hypothetical protein Fmac_019597 [Flemingia macrophylla]|uniref:FF domain-containing protein n=1 Tax=Flemingia macrophylla TaxID=520843 RepID=A0ABD1M896_9FABA